MYYGSTNRLNFERFNRVSISPESLGALLDLLGRQLASHHFPKRKKTQLGIKDIKQTRLS